MNTTVISYCRLCFNSCPIEVDVADGVAEAVRGVRDDEVYRGYTCLKGRSQPDLLRSPNRLLSSQVRKGDGTFEPIGWTEAARQIAAQLRAITDESGPDSVAFYRGTMASGSSTSASVFTAFARAFGSSLQFSPNTIDKPGKMIASALHGRWDVPVSGYSDPEVALLLGINPPISYQGVPRGNPAGWLTEQTRRGMALIVVDPRRTETARRAQIHLQARPGTDALVLASFLHVILTEQLWDQEFAAEHLDGVDRLAAAVEPFSPHLVAARADLDVEQLREAARIFGRSRRGYVSVGTGPNMAGPGTLVEYLALCLDSLCGHVAREGEVVRNAPTLLPVRDYRAQMNPPTPAFGIGETLPASGLTRSVAGPPVAGLPHEMMRSRGGRVRALISMGGNPASAWPDLELVTESLRELDLLVQIDPFMSNTARLAHYVIAPTMPLEQTDMSQVPLDTMSQLTVGYGLADSYAHYSAAVAEPPAGSDVVDEWVFLHQLATELGLTLEVNQQPGAAIEPVTLKPGERPGTDELLDSMARGSRVPLDDVRRAGGGRLYPDPACVVLPPEPGWSGRANVGDPTMLSDLAAQRAEPVESSERPLRLIPRRVQHVYNSSHHQATASRVRIDNPAYLHPDDLAERGLAVGDEVVISSDLGSMSATVEADSDLRHGVVSMTHCYGGLPDDDPAEASTPAGVNLGLIVGMNHLQPYSGQPVMGNVPVEVRRVQR